MKQDDPRRLAARKERDDARFDLDILTMGIGGILMNNGHQFEPEDVRRLMGRINGDLMAAVERVEKADEEYYPFWARRRRYRVPKKKTKAKAAKKAA